MTEDVRFYSREDYDWYFDLHHLSEIPFNRWTEKWIKKEPEQTDECMASALLERSQKADARPISQLPDGPSQKQIDLLTLMLLFRAFEGPKRHPPAAVMKLVIHRLLRRHGIDEAALNSLDTRSALRTSLDPKDIPDWLLTAWDVEHHHILYSKGGKQASVNHVAKAAGVSRDTIRRWRAYPMYQDFIERAKSTRLGWEQRILAKSRR